MQGRGLRATCPPRLARESPCDARRSSDDRVVSGARHYQQSEVLVGSPERSYDAEGHRRARGRSRSPSVRRTPVRREEVPEMSDRSTIEWTDATWNPVTGCTQVS